MNQNGRNDNERRKEEKTESEDKGTRHKRLHTFVLTSHKGKEGNEEANDTVKNKEISWCLWFAQV